MTFSRGRVGEIRPGDLNALVRRMLRLLERIATSRVETDVRLARLVPWVLADAAQLEQILVNLVVNARDAMPDGGELTMSTGRRELERLGFLRVRDTGIGMDEATKARIFDRCSRRSPRAAGRGSVRDRVGRGPARRPDRRRDRPRRRNDVHDPPARGGCRQGGPARWERSGARGSAEGESAGLVLRSLRAARAGRRPERAGRLDGRAALDLDDLRRRPGRGEQDPGEDERHAERLEL
jgi:hypothetical protein